MTRAELGDFTTDRRVLILTAMAVVIGCMSAVVAALLLWLINAITSFSYFQYISTATISPGGHRLGWLAIFVPVIGGLLIGLMARFGSSKIRGHGIPEALEAILIGRSRMDVKVAILKPLSSALSIGTGGPFGAEGPIIMTGGAFGSLFAQLFHLSPAERKTLLVSGAAGGMAAIFSAPVAAVLLAVELLLFEWKPRSFVPVACAATIAAALRPVFIGPGPIFPIMPHESLAMVGLVYALGIGIVGGFMSGLLTAMVYAAEDAFERLPIHWMWWPAIGGLCVGIGGMIEPRVLGVGYETIHALLLNNLTIRTVIAVLIVKAVVWAISLGSGTSGGVLAPLLMMGAALGVVEATWLPLESVAVGATLSMAATMAGTMRSPLTALAFTLELTHDFALMPALLTACVAAQAVNVLLMKRSILTEKIARRGLHLSREYSVDPFQIHRVQEIMRTDVVPLQMDSDWKSVAPRLGGQWNAPVVNAEGEIEGIITQSDILRLLASAPDGNGRISDVASRKLIVTYPEETVSDAVKKLLQHDIGRLPVVDSANPRRLQGMLDRATVMIARQRWHEEEHMRESGWFSYALSKIKGMKTSSQTGSI